MIDSPGLIENNHQLVLTLVSGQAANPEEIANIVVKTTPAGFPSGSATSHRGSVRDARVHDRYRERQAGGAAEYLPSAGQQHRCRRRCGPCGDRGAFARRCPRASSCSPSTISPTLVRDSINSVRDAILIGLVLAAIILVLFLRDWGSSLVAGLVIPATIAITLIALRVLGESFNLMTLGGLAAAVGLVIDDAIVVVENIVLHRDAGQSRAEAIRSAICAKSAVPLVGSTITPIVVFLPLISITGVTGMFFRALAITVGMALLTSLALALTWTPTLSHYLLRNRRKSSEAPASHEPGSNAGVHGPPDPRL